MSLYDNFRAPQYVDFAGIHGGSEMNTDTSSFFDRDTDMESTPSIGKKFCSSVSSFNGSFSDNDTTLTPTKFRTSADSTREDAHGDNSNQKIALTPLNASCATVVTPMSSVKSVKFGNNSPVIRNADTFNDSLSVEGFNLPSFRMSTPMVQQDGNTQIKSKEVSYGSPLRKTFRFAETSATKVSTPCETPTASSANLSGSKTSVSRKSRCSGLVPKHNRRSRSTGSTKKIVTEEEILNDALQTLSISSSLRKISSGDASEVDHIPSPMLVPDSLPPVNKVLNNKTPSKIKGVGPKRKLSPPPKNSRDYGQQPAKYMSMAEQVAKIQKQTPKRFRTLPSAAALKKGVTSKVARSLSSQPKSAPVSSGPSKPNHSVALKNTKNQDRSSGDKGVRVARWPQPKVEPFVLTQYKKKELPKTVFSFEQEERVLLRDRKTPIKRSRKPTTVVPFSFDKRDQEIMQRKINRRMGVEIQSHCCQNKGRRRSKSQGDENCRNTVKDPLVHHARVPSVLQKPPFVPKKHLKVTKPIDFCLNTEKRAKEREEFDEHMKQKEMERLDMLNKLKEERRLQEEKEVLKLRKEMVHKARPVPAFHPFKVHPSDAPLTEPCTPKFVSHSKRTRDPSVCDDPMEC